MTLTKYSPQVDSFGIWKPSGFWKRSSEWLNICGPFLFIPLKWSSFMEQAVKLSGRASDCSFIYFYWAWGIGYMGAACIWTVWLTVWRWGRRKGEERKVIKELFEVDLNRVLEGTTGCNTNNTSLKSRDKKVLWYYFCLNVNNKVLEVEGHSNIENLNALDGWSNEDWRNISFQLSTHEQ